jgi:hypothetical protein
MLAAGAPLQDRAATHGTARLGGGKRHQPACQRRVRAIEFGHHSITAHPPAPESSRKSGDLRAPTTTLPFLLQPDASVCGLGHDR